MSGVAPDRWSSRCIVIVWFFECLFITISFTANLTATVLSASLQACPVQSCPAMPGILPPTILYIYSYMPTRAAAKIHQTSIAGIYQLLYNELGLKWATVGGSSSDTYYASQTTLANQQLYNTSNRSATSYWEAVQYTQNDSNYVLYYDGLMNTYQAYNSCSAILDASTTIGAPSPRASYVSNLTWPTQHPNEYESVQHSTLTPWHRARGLLVRALARRDEDLDRHDQQVHPHDARLSGHQPDLLQVRSSPLSPLPLRATLLGYVYDTWRCSYTHSTRNLNKNHWKS